MPFDVLETQDTLRPEVAKQLAPAEVVDVTVHEEVDHDGDPVLRVVVTFRAIGDRLDPKRVAGLIRHLRTALANRDEYRFPLVSFRTEKEAQEETDEAN